MSDELNPYNRADIELVFDTAEVIAETKRDWIDCGNFVAERYGKEGRDYFYKLLAENMKHPSKKDDDDDL